MYRNLFIIGILFICGLVFLPINTYALNFNNYNNYVQILDDELGEPESCESILGDPNDEDSVAWLIQLVLNVSRVVAVMIILILSSVNYLTVIVKSDDEALTKANKRLGLRLILLLFFFFVPNLTMAILNLFGWTTDPTCGLQ